MMFNIARIASRFGINLNYVVAPRTAFQRREALRQSHMTRRSILTALPATGAAIALPFSAKADTSTPVMRLFHQWEQARSGLSLRHSEEECDRAVDRMTQLEDQMIALPSQNMSDLAAKIVAYSSWGDFGLPGPENKLWTELQSLVSDA